MNDMQFNQLRKRVAILYPDGLIIKAKLNTKTGKYSGICIIKEKIKLAINSFKTKAEFSSRKSAIGEIIEICSVMVNCKD